MVFSLFFHVVTVVVFCHVVADVFFCLCCCCCCFLFFLLLLLISSLLLSFLYCSCGDSRCVVFVAVVIVFVVFVFVWVFFVTAAATRRVAEADHPLRVVLPDCKCVCNSVAHGIELLIK